MSVIKLFEIECITNLQVGSGETNVDVIDIKVERDRNVPCIFSSSLKGALREHYKKVKGDDCANELFGNQDKDGKLKIMQAFLVSMPMRVSEGDSNYVNVCNATTINHINHLYKSLNLKEPYNQVIAPKDNVFVGNSKIKKVEGIKCIDGAKLDDNTLVANDNLFSLIPLPIKIRNNLNEGNRNLWYEEYVPYGSKFVFSIIGEEADINELSSTFEPYVQIGGNSSLGFGICKIKAK